MRISSFGRTNRDVKIFPNLQGLKTSHPMHFMIVIKNGLFLLSGFEQLFFFYTLGEN